MVYWRLNLEEMIRKELVDDLKLKWENIRRDMCDRGYDACLLAMDVNLLYVSGQVYNGYFYLPATGDPLFFVKRPGGLEGDGVYNIRKPEQILEYFVDLGIKKPEALLLEADELSYSEYMRLHALFTPTKTGNASSFMREIRKIKTPWEIEQFRQSGHQHTKTYAEIPQCYRPGMTDLEFQYEIESLMRKNGSLGVFRTFGANMDIFMGSILAGENAETPSPFDFALGGAGMDPSLPIGANGTPLKEGTAIMVDMAGNYTPYMTDMTRVFAVGQLSELAYKTHQVSLDIQYEIEAKAVPGLPASEVYAIAETIANREGLSAYFMGTKQQAKFVGHGIGLQINELPVFTPRSKDVLIEGMVFALEPKFVVPGVGATGVENSFLVTVNGLEKLTNAVENIVNL